jgi:hypothetical protein
MTRDEDLVARRVLSVERNQLLQKGQRRALGGWSIEAFLLLRGGNADARKENDGSKSEGQRAKGKGQRRGTRSKAKSGSNV